MASISEETLRQAKILMVDDEVSSLCLLENILARLGFPRTKKLLDPKRILSEFDSFQPDLIITDLSMPGMDGVHLTEKLRAYLPSDYYLPILVLTGNTDTKSKRACLMAGATDILFKPFDCSEILMHIRNLLRTRFQHLEINTQNQMLEGKVADRTFELERALQELKTSQRQLIQQERLRAFGEMAGGVVHDFNNALMSIIGYSELLIQDETLADDRTLLNEYLKTMNTAGRDASHVVSRLRDFYRPREESDLFDSVNINDLIQEVLPLTKPKWHGKALESGRTISMELELQRVPLASGNSAELREVFTNLIFNAVDAIPGHGTITLRTSSLPDGIQIEVSDSGSGMTEEVRQRCLEPFFSTKGNDGSGLGLSMVFGIIRRHGGKLDIDQPAAGGTTFRIMLPLYEPRVSAPAQDQQKLDRKLRVLIVDDEPNTRNVVAKYLQFYGHMAVTAGSGSEALEYFKNDTFDLVMTDHGMAGMSGIEFAQRLRTLHGDQKIIMLTGFASDPAPFMESVNCVLKKPLVPEVLRSAIQTVFTAPVKPRLEVPASASLTALDALMAG